MSERKGDGVFRWYVAHEEEAEYFDASADTREAALAEGLKKYGDTPFVLIEADKFILSYDIFDAYRIIEKMEDHNEECWGEDGLDMGEDFDGASRLELEAFLAAALQGWLAGKGMTPRVWGVCTYRTVENINVPAEKAVRASE